MQRLALGLGLGTKNAQGEWLEVFFPRPLLHPPQELLSAFLTPAELAQDVVCKDLPPDTECPCPQQRDLLRTLLQTGGRGERQETVLVFLRRDLPLSRVPEAYLKLHLISHRLVTPNTLNLKNIFKVLPVVAWTNRGPLDPTEIAADLFAARCGGAYLRVHAVDKLPCLSDYVIPSGVRIANTARVRLGAYLGEGTTVMHAGFINFNAGTSGPAMVEGRISQGVMLGAGSDLGGGASTMGVLSGGNDELIAVGRNCLIGANAGIGISLGDNCTVEAGLYVTAGAKVSLLLAGKKKKIVGARELSGHSDLLFRRNSQTGQLECLTRIKGFTLNQELHCNT